MQAPCQTGAKLLLPPPCLCRASFGSIKAWSTQSRNFSGLCQAKGQSYHVEVAVTEDEDPEGVYKRFRNSCNLAGMVYEARRRQRFENRQDIKKRKQQEKGQKKIRDMREKYLVTYEEIHTDTPPFVDLFTGEDDMYDIAGEMGGGFGVGRSFMGSTDSMDGLDDEDEGDSGVPVQVKPIKGSARPDASSGPRAGFVGRNTENFTRRSVASQGPAQKTETTTNKAATKPKSQVETARTRKAAKQQSGQDSKQFASAGIGSKPVKGGNKGKGPKAKK